MSLTATAARRRLLRLIEQINDDQQSVEIVSDKGAAYLVPANEYRSLVETVYLLRSPFNAARLRAALDEVDGASRDTKTRTDSRTV